jgi:hypothetical protein
VLRRIAYLDRKEARSTLFGVAIALCCSVPARADCIAKLHAKNDRPVYEVVSCGPAEPIVEKLRQSRPDWFGKFSYAESDVVLTVRAANSAARKRMWEETEYWYYPSGCMSILEGMRFARPQLKELCCDVGPVNTLPCGIGGTQLLTLKGAR